MFPGVRMILPMLALASSACASVVADRTIPDAPVSTQPKSDPRGVAPAAVAVARKPGLGRVTFALREGGPSCTIELDGAVEEHATYWVLRDVTMMRVLQGDTCDEQELFDGKGPASEDEDDDYIDATVFPRAVWTKPGQRLTDDEKRQLGWTGYGLVDLDVDGFVDLCMPVGGANEPHVCWLFDDRGPRYEQVPDVSEIPSLTIHAGAVFGTTRNGDVEVTTEHRWQGLTLVLHQQTTRIRGATAEGSPIAGTTVVVEEIRRNKMVRVHEHVEAP